MICANVGPFSAAQFAGRLHEIRQRSDVAAVFIRFCEYDDALEFEDCWIGSDSVYIVSSASLETIRDWFQGLDVSEVWDEIDLNKFPDVGQIPDGFRLVGIWWD